MNEISEKSKGEILHRFKTKRGTFVEMIKCPTIGIACYMDNVIQSCELDEKKYHESLVCNTMNSISNPKRVMIIGGGEGATAREVLKYKSVMHVDMYEWDEDVVKLFKQYYPQWAMGAWDDKRLHIHYEDIFEVVAHKNPVDLYDVIIIDLFDPSHETCDQLINLLCKLEQWLTIDGSLVMYAGMYDYNREDTYNLMEYITSRNLIFKNHMRTLYKVPIESFCGESIFLMLTYCGLNNSLEENPVNKV